MGWIEAYRRRLGMSREQFAAAITHELGGGLLTVPANLIYILESRPGAVTSPKLANLIARACGATKAQRDMIVHPSRRGEAYQHSAAAITAKRVSERPAGGERRAKPGRAVVILDRAGNEVARVDSVMAAAALIGASNSTVVERCHRATRQEFGATHVFTCRYADEWDGMTPAARAADMREALARGEAALKRGLNAARPVVAVDRAARELARYASIGDAAAGEHRSQTWIRNRCSHRVNDEQADRTFRFADEWDGMSKREQMKDVGAAL